MPSGSRKTQTGAAPTPTALLGWMVIKVIVLRASKVVTTDVELRAQFSTLMGILVPLILVQPAVTMISVIRALQAGPHATQTSMQK